MPAPLVSYHKKKAILTLVACTFIGHCFLTQQWGNSHQEREKKKLEDADSM
jgi:hypothetical protein